MAMNDLETRLSSGSIEPLSSPIMLRSRRGPLKRALTKAAAFAVLGGVVGALLFDWMPRDYAVETRLKIDAPGADPRSIADAAANLRSKARLDQLIRTLDLDHTSEFAVDRTSMLTLVSDIVSGRETTVGQAEAVLRRNLAQAVSTNYDPAAGAVTISVTAAGVDEAARMANALGAMLRDDMAATGLPGTDPEVSGVREELEKAQAGLSGFLAGVDGKRLAQLRRAESEERALAAQVSGTEAELVNLRGKLEQAAAMSVADVLDKPLPNSLEFTALDYQRQRFVEAKLALDQLSGDLGPRHPRLLAGQAALESVRSDIGKGLERLVSSLKEQEAATAKRLADLQARQQAKSVDAGAAEAASKLAKLESAVEQARTGYLTALQRSEKAARSAPATASIIKPASSEAASPLGPSRLLLSGAGAAAGLLLGGIFALSGRRQDTEAELDALLEHEDLLLMPEPQGALETALEQDRASLDPPASEKPATPVARYPAPANDTPFGDQIRSILMANRMPRNEADLPPLLSAIEEGQAPVSLREKDVLALRRDMAAIRQRVQTYAARRSASGG